MRNDDSGVPGEDFRLLVEKFLAGTATPEEEAKLKAWYRSFDDAADTVVETTREETAAAILARIHDQITPGGAQGGADVHAAPALIRPLHRHRNSWIAAAAAVAIVITGWLVFKNRPKTPQNAMEIAVTRGQRQKAYLPDSTLVWVNAGSRLHYQESPNGNREVDLDGEAFFDVRQDAGRPFVVKAGATVTRVLGTTFDVKAYAQDSIIHVTLATGKIRVETSGTPQTLQPDQQLDFTTRDNRIHVHNLQHTALYTSWIDGRIDFDGATFAEVAGTLNRKFGVAFRFQHEDLKHCVFLAGFDGDTPLKKILDLLCRTGNYNYTFNNDNSVVTIGGTGCPDKRTTIH